MGIPLILDRFRRSRNLSISVFPILGLQANVTIPSFYVIYGITLISLCKGKHFTYWTIYSRLLVLFGSVLEIEPHIVAHTALTPRQSSWLSFPSAGIKGKVPERKLGVNWGIYTKQVLPWVVFPRHLWLTVRVLSTCLPHPADLWLFSLGNLCCQGCTDFSGSLSPSSWIPFL